jgi:hypothetical protein
MIRDMLGKRRASLSESYAAVIAVAFGLMAIALAIYAGNLINGYASSQLIKSNIWGAIIAYTTVNQTMIIIQNIGHDAFYINATFIDGYPVSTIVRGSGHLQETHYAGPGLGPNQYIELSTSRRGSIAQAQLCSINDPKVCTVIWTYINYTLKTAAPSIRGTGLGTTITISIIDPYNADWTLNWSGGATGSTSENKSETILINSASNASAVEACLYPTPSPPYYPYPRCISIMPGSSTSMSIEYNSTGTIYVSDTYPNSSWILDWSGYSTGSIMGNGSDMIRIPAGTGVNVTLMAKSWDGEECIVKPSEARLEAQGFIAFTVINCPNYNYYLIYFNATTPLAGYSLLSIDLPLTFSNQPIVTAYLDDPIRLATGWNKAPLPPGIIQPNVTVMGFTLMLSGPEIASWALPTATYVWDINGTIIKIELKWIRGSGLYVLNVPGEVFLGPRINSSRTGVISVLLGWLELNGAPINSPIIPNNWPWWTTVKAATGSISCMNGLKVMTSLGDYSLIIPSILQFYQVKIPLPSPATSVNITTSDSNCALHWSDPQMDILSLAINPITLSTGNTYYFWVAHQSTSGGALYDAYITVNDSDKAGWSISTSNGQTLTGSGSISKAMITWSSRSETTLTASIVSNPINYTCSINPTTAQASNGGNYAFMVSCTPIMLPPGTSGGGGTEHYCSIDASTTSNVSLVNELGLDLVYPITAIVKGGSYTYFLFEASNSVSAGLGFINWLFTASSGSITPSKSGNQDAVVKFACPANISKNITVSLIGLANYGQNSIKFTDFPTSLQYDMGNPPPTSVADYDFSWSIYTSNIQSVNWGGIKLNNTALEAFATIWLGTGSELNAHEITMAPSNMCPINDTVLTIVSDPSNSISNPGNNGSENFVIQYILACEKVGN